MTAASLPQRTKELILTLPETSCRPRARKPRTRRPGGSDSTNGDPARLSNQVAQPDVARTNARGTPLYASQNKQNSLNSYSGHSQD